MPVNLVTDRSTDRPLSGAPEAAKPDESANGGSVKEKAVADGKTTDAGLTFADVLDVINPLQHLPILSGLYREITGDQISPGARLLGGTLFGGPIGLICGMVDGAIEEGSGRDIGGNLVAMLKGDPLGKEAVQTLAKAKEPELAPVEAAETPPPAAQIAKITQEPLPSEVPSTPAIASKGFNLPAEGGRIAITEKAPMGTGGTIGVPMGATGLTGGKANLPSSGMITPAATMMQLQPLGQAQPGEQDPSQSFSGLAGVAALQTQRSAPPGIAMAAGGDAPPLEKGWFKLPERTGRTATRDPVALERWGAAKQPAGLGSTAILASEIQPYPRVNAGQTGEGNPSQLTDAMARALDKYEALVKNRAKSQTDES